VFHSGSLLVLPTKIRLRWKSMQEANTLANYNTPIITAVKSFIVQAPGDIFVSSETEKNSFITLTPRPSTTEISKT
jgi:hypothetical protein